MFLTAFNMFKDNHNVPSLGVNNEQICFKLLFAAVMEQYTKVFSYEIKIGEKYYFRVITHFVKHTYLGRMSNVAKKCQSQGYH